MQEKQNEVFLEVRKAYRFLFEYQKRVLELADYIGNTLGFNYLGGYPKFSNVTPRNGYGTLNSWAWDWLNMYFYEFRFIPHKDKKTQKDKVNFSVFILNDTGYYDVEKERRADKTKTDTYKSVEDSASKLILVAGRYMGNENTWSDWGKWKYEGNIPDFLKESEGFLKDYHDGDRFYKHYPLERFINEKDALDCITDFVQLCNKHNIELKMRHNEFK